MNSANDRLRGLQNKIDELGALIKGGKDGSAFDGDALKAARSIIKDLKKQHREISDVLKSADKAVEKLGKIK